MLTGLGSVPLSARSAELHADRGRHRGRADHAVSAMAARPSALPHPAPAEPDEPLHGTGLKQAGEGPSTWPYDPLTATKRLVRGSAQRDFRRDV
jgi:hypothetical protein